MPPEQAHFSPLMPGGEDANAASVAAPGKPLSFAFSAGGWLKVRSLQVWLARAGWLLSPCRDLCRQRPRSGRAFTPTHVLGCAQMYFFGVCKCLQVYRLHEGGATFSGASSGSLMAAMLALGIDAKEIKVRAARARIYASGPRARVVTCSIVYRSYPT